MDGNIDGTMTFQEGKDIYLQRLPSETATLFVPASDILVCTTSLGLQTATSWLTLQLQLLRGRMETP